MIHDDRDDAVMPFSYPKDSLSFDLFFSDVPETVTLFHENVVQLFVSTKGSFPHLFILFCISLTHNSHHRTLGGLRLRSVRHEWKLGSLEVSHE